jgi:hypothetical protein
MFLLITNNNNNYEIVIFTIVITISAIIFLHCGHICHLRDFCHSFLNNNKNAFKINKLYKFARKQACSM